MAKRIISLIITLTMLVSMFASVSVYAAIDEEEDIPEQISTVKEAYKPGETYFGVQNTA